MEIGKSWRLMKTVFLSVFCLAPRDWAITIEFPGRDRVYGDEEKKREKNALRKLVATEILNREDRNSVRIKDKNK